MSSCNIPLFEQKEAMMSEKQKETIMNELERDEDGTVKISIPSAEIKELLILISDFYRAYQDEMMERDDRDLISRIRWALL